jgi:hypothetical protein
MALVVPALIHGIHLGPYDLLSRNGLLRRPGVVAHNSWVGDQIAQMIPWTTQAWTQVHQGHLPLWNSFSGLGMPLAFNWQSAPFGLPALVGYVFPLQYAYTVGILFTVAVTGTGGYFLGRVLGLGALGCAMVGTVFELSGPFVGWLGWPHAAVFSWAGWLFAAAILVVQVKQPIRAMALFAVVLAFVFYAGQPEVLVVLLIALAGFLVVLLALRAWRRGPRSMLRPALHVSIAGVAGVALAAPLVLPGLQVFAASVHSKTAGQSALPAENLVHTIAQGFDGLPLAGSQTFGSDGPFYVGAFIGVIALILAFVAVVAWFRRPVIAAFAAVAIVSCGVVFLPFLISAIDALPFVGSVGWTRALLPMAFALAVLSGCGMDALVRRGRDRLWWWAGISFSGAGVVVVGLLIVSSGGLSATDRGIRAHSFLGPIIEVVVGLAMVGLVLLQGRRDPDSPDGRDLADTSTRPPRPQWKQLRSASMAGLGLLACETVFLVAAGAPLWSSSSTYFTPTTAVTALQSDVGSSLVGFGTSLGYSCLGLGIQPDANIGFGIHELAVYDPMVPKKYFSSYAALTGRSAGNETANEYCPAITELSEARLYGVAFILEPADGSAPTGSTFVARLGSEDLYHVPGSYAATLTPLGADGRLPTNDEVGRPVAVTHVDPSNWHVDSDAASPQVLRLRLTDAPGWHASIDGRPLALESYAGMMLQARVPAGRHSIDVDYWPTTFTLGIVIAICSLVGLMVALVIDGIRRRRLVTS